MSRIALVILVDGFRHDYLNPTDTPFMWKLADQGTTTAVRETFAFQLRPAFFAGLYPEDCDIAHLYWYEPEASPFWFTKYLPEWLLAVPRVRRYYSKFLHDYPRTFEARLGHTASSLYASPAEIPYKLLRYFGFSEKYITWESGALGENVTLFDVMRSHGSKWLWIAYPTDNQRTTAILHAFERNIQVEHSLAYLHFAELDWVGHSHGPHSFEQRSVIRGIDLAIEQIYDKLSSMFDKIYGVIFGDHGMVHVKYHLDIQDLLQSADLRPGKDFVYFLDSTQARFWFNNSNAKTEVLELLSRLDRGRVLNEEDFSRLHFRFPHNRFGDTIFVVDDNTIIYPNFFQRSSAPEGMHGYLPEIEGNWGRLIVSGVDVPNCLPHPVEMVDLYPTILDMLGLPIPQTNKGRSLLSRSEV